MSPQPELGQALRALRLEGEKSLTEVASATEISASFLSMVENGSSDISIGRLLRVTQYYGVEIGDVLSGAAPRTSHVIRAGEHRRLASLEERVDLEFLADPACPIRPALVRFEPDARMVDYVRAAGDAFIYVLDGEIAVDLGEADTIALSAGDSAYLPSHLPRRYENRTPEPVSLLSVVVRQDRSVVAAAPRPARQKKTSPTTALDAV